MKLVTDGFRAVSQPLTFFSGNSTSIPRFQMNNNTFTRSGQPTYAINTQGPNVLAPMNSSPTTYNFALMNIESGQPTAMNIEPGSATGSAGWGASNVSFLGSPYSGVFFFQETSIATIQCVGISGGTVPPFAWLQGGTERCRMDSSGRFIVGSTTTLAGSNGERFQVRSTSTNPASAFYVNQPYNSTNQSIIWFFVSSPDANGGVLFGNNNTIGVASTSDVRQKRDVRPMTHALGTIQRLRPIRFNWIDQPNEIKSWGFLAHEVQEIIPDMVQTPRDAVDDDGEPIYQTLDVGYLVPLLTRACQELEQELTALEADIQAITQGDSHGI